jgi:ribonuclease HI
MNKNNTGVSDKKCVEIYTDGSSLGNPGPAGWAAILIHGKYEKEFSGGSEHATNNYMELTAAIEGLKQLKYPCRVKLYSDSAYLVNAFQDNWFRGWIKNSWRKPSGEPVKNKELWEELLTLSTIHSITWIKVRAHADNSYNNRCDALAVEQSTKYKKSE